VSKRPLAQRHLIRINELVTNASIFRVVEERGLVQHEVIARSASDDRACAEEVQALAEQRGWSVPHNKSYAWSLMANWSDPLPRVVRIVDRDIFELDGIYRETDDDDVGSLAARLLNERRVAKRELEAVRPELGLPGAK
jgi:hypothetical protein